MECINLDGDWGKLRSLVNESCRDGTLSRFIVLKSWLSLSFKCNNELFDVNIFFKRFFDEMGLNENVRLRRFFALYKPLEWRWNRRSCLSKFNQWVVSYVLNALPTEFKPLLDVALIVECVDKVSLSLIKSMDESGVNAPFSGPTFSISDVWNGRSLFVSVERMWDGHYFIKKTPFFCNSFC